MRKRIVIAFFFAAIILALPITSVSGSKLALSKIEKANSNAAIGSSGVEDVEEILNYYTEELKSIDPTTMAPEEALYMINTIFSDALEVMKNAGLGDIDDSGAVAQAMQQAQMVIYSPIGNVDCGDLAAEIAALFALYAALAKLCSILAENAWAHLTLAAIVCGAAAAALGALMQAISTFLSAGCPEEMISGILSQLDDISLPPGY